MVETTSSKVIVACFLTQKVHTSIRDCLFCPWFCAFCDLDTPLRTTRVLYCLALSLGAWDEPEALGVSGCERTTSSGRGRHAKRIQSVQHMAQRRPEAGGHPTGEDSEHLNTPTEFVPKHGWLDFV